jgi:hypothetical protein
MGIRTIRPKVLAESNFFFIGFGHWPNNTFFFVGFGHWPNHTISKYCIRPSVFFFFFRPRLKKNMIGPKNKIYDSAKRILCLAMLMEKTGKLKKTYAIRPKKFNIWQR